MVGESESLKKEIIDIEKAFKKMRRELDSTSTNLLKNTKSEKEHHDVVNRLIRVRQLEMRDTLKGVDKNSSIYKVRVREYSQEIGDLRRKRKEFGAFNQAVGVGKTAVVEFGRNLKGNIVLGLVNLAKGIFNSGARFIDAEERIKSFSDTVKDFGDVPYLGKGLTALAKSADFNVGISKQLAQTGASFESSIINLRNAAHEANMPILDFVDMIQKNSTIMATLFGTVDSGVKRMSQFQRALRTTTQEQFAQFGLNLEETSEFFQTYLMRQKAIGRLTLGTAEEEVAQSAKYIKNLEILSKLTGEEISELDKRNRQLSLNGALQRQLADMAPEQRRAIESAINMYGGLDDPLGKLIAQVVTLNGATENETALLDSLAGNGLVPVIKALQSGRLNFTDFTNTVGNLMNRGYLSSFGKDLSRVSIYNQEHARVLDTVNRYQKRAALSIENETKKRDTSSAGFVSAKDSIDVFKAGAESLTTGTVDTMSKTLGFLKESLNKLGEDPRSKALLKSGNITAGVLTSVFSTGNKALRITKDKAPEEGILERIGRILIPRMVQGSTAGDIEAETYMEFKSGTKDVTGQRFPDFGNTGTVVKVHDHEAIIPKESPMGKIVAAVDGLSVKPTVNTPVTASATATNTSNNEEFTRITTLLNRSLDNISQIMDKSEKHLNTLVGINATVAKNTMDTKRGLANLSSSIV